jgi:hypothetical protein
MSALHLFQDATIAGTGATLLLLGIYAWGVNHVAFAASRHRPTAAAVAAGALCFLIGAMMFLGAWTLS